MFYTSNPFDRADQLRKDEATTSDLFNSDRSKVIPYFNGKMLVSRADNSAHNSAEDRANHRLQQPVVLTLRSSALPQVTADWVFLGFKDHIPYFAIDLSELDKSALPEPLSNGTVSSYEWEGLRAIGPRLSPDDGAMLAYAQALMHWQQQCTHCNVCGSKTQSSLSGHVRVCSNPACAKEIFPRTDPAVIMLVTTRSADNNPANERCLLGRSPMWASGVYSTLAGFVEPGETLESAVSREVFEEAGIHTSNVTYMASQPWPFPQSIMLGFRAEATSTDIKIDPDELADAAWFTRSELAEFGNWGDSNYALQLPRQDSIARYLIDTWKNNKAT